MTLLRLTGTLYCRSELTAPWGIDLPAFEGCMMFYVVTAGRCWLETEGGGDFTQVICVVVRFDHVAAEHLIALLPRVLQIDTWEDGEGSWLLSTLRFISREAKELRPGGETVITRLADILVIQMIRSWIDSAPEGDRGWLAALRDEQVGRALTLVHREPTREWTVASFAQEIGMSRSAFSARFTTLVGESAMRYLTQWRMSLAGHLGYRSEATSCRAFKRVFGVPRGSVRGERTHRGLTGDQREAP